ncbi:hypothetical protein [Neisseria sp. Ec49-e6-T10]|uniref:hypothetical protein n=1 Tax=Neisseria sp. Ec49-e6-T10 TaxID=3140744 RepID=UPI003EB6D22D
MDIVSYKCPKCSTALIFDIKKQNWQCQFCRSEFTQTQLENNAEILDSNSSTLPPHASTDTNKIDDHEENKLYYCPSCGGKILTTHNTVATFCVYCHNPAIVASKLEEDINKPDYLIPFKQTKADAINALQKACQNKLFLPKTFKELVKKGEVFGLYVPFWLFDIDTNTHLQSQTTQVSTWQDEHYQYSKIDYYQVQRAGQANFQKIPADGSAKMNDDLMDQLEPFHYNQMEQFDLAYLSGHFAEIHDVKIEETTERVLKRVYPEVERMITQTVTGYSSINSTQIDMNQTINHISVMLPVWTVMTQYNKKTFVFAMNGQTGKVTGRLPISNMEVFKKFITLSTIISVCHFVWSIL